MLLDSTIVTMAVWITNYNKTYTTNSGGTATYSHCIDRINDHMIQMQARAEACTYWWPQSFLFLLLFFQLPPKIPNCNRLSTKPLESNPRLGQRWAKQELEIPNWGKNPSLHDRCTWIYSVLGGFSFSNFGDTSSTLGLSSRSDNVRCWSSMPTGYY